MIIVDILIFNYKIFFTVFKPVNFYENRHLHASDIFDVFKDAIYIFVAFNEDKQSVPHYHIEVVRRNSQKVTTQMEIFKNKFNLNNDELQACPIWFSVTNTTNYISKQQTESVTSKGKFNQPIAYIPWGNPLERASGFSWDHALPYEYIYRNWAIQGCPPYFLSKFIDDEIILLITRQKYIEFSNWLYNLHNDSIHETLIRHYNERTRVVIKQKEYSDVLLELLDEEISEYCDTKAFFADLNFDIDDVHDKFNFYLAEPGIFINIQEYLLSDSQKDDDDQDLIKFIRDIILRKGIFINVESVVINIENEDANINDFAARLLNI